MKQHIREKIKKFYSNYNKICNLNSQINEDYKTNYSWQYNIAGITGVGDWFYSCELIKKLCHYFKGNQEFLEDDDLMEIEYIVDYEGGE